jgi:hypothetical protein
MPSQSGHDQHQGIQAPQLGNWGGAGGTAWGETSVGGHSWQNGGHQAQPSHPAAWDHSQPVTEAGYLVI